MFKSSRWKGEKNKIKAVFQLQFQATQVPQMKAKKLSISVVPSDIGKPTVRLEKAPILDGACNWKNPVYETVKLVKDIKTGEFGEKCYHFIVSSGSSKSGILGQVSVNLADYVEAAKPITESLPLIALNNGAATGTILCVTIQNIHDSADQRASEGESQEGSMNSRLTNDDKNESNRLNYIEDDITLRQNNTIHQRSDTDWSMGSASDESLEDNLQTAKSSNVSGRPADTLEKKISLLERQAELSELELQSLRKQIAKENKRGHDLSKEVTVLKEENGALEMECHKLKSSIRESADDDVEDSKKSQVGTKELEEKLDVAMKKIEREKGFNKILRSRVQKAEDANSEMVFKIRDLNQNLKIKNNEIADLRSGDNEKKASREVADRGNKDKEVQLLNKKIADLYNELEGCKKDREELETQMEQLNADYEILKQDNHNLSLKFEENEMEKINMQNECSEYIATLQEFQVQNKRLQKENKKLSLDLREDSNTICELENHVKDLEKEIEELAQGYENDLEVVTLGKIEEEQRAIKAEEALRKMKSNNAIAIERVQEELKRVSLEMSSKFGENEKLAIEANELHMQKQILEEMLQKANEEIRLITERYETKLLEISCQKNLKLEESERVLQSEIATLNARYNGSKQRLFEVEVESENLRKEVSKLEGELRKKEEKIAVIEGKLKSNGERARISDAKGTTSKQKFSSDKKKHPAQDAARAEKMDSTGKGRAHNKSEVEAALENNTRLLSEMELVKEKNKLMEGELKDMEERYSEISLKFAEVEGERQQLVMAVRNLKNSKKS